MSARRVQWVAGWTALIAGVLLVIGMAVSSVASVGSWSVGSTGAGNGMAGPGMMGPGMMRMMGGRGGALTSGAAPIAGAPEVRVEAANFSFAPSEIRLPKDAAVNLTLVNPTSTGVLHDLTVPGLGIRVVASAGQSSTVGLRALPAGRYPAYCSVPGHADAGMRATVIVE